MSTDDTTLIPPTPILEREPEALAPHMESNSALVAKTLNHASHGFLARLFPGELDQVVQTHEVEQLQTGFEYRRRALRMAVETKLQAVEEMCNHVLVTGKSEIRRKRQEFFADQKLKLEESMNACAERFQEQTERRLGALAAIPNEHIRGREEQRLLRAVDDFYDMLDQLGREFLDIIREGVSRG
jgi:hypothetical protein